MLAEVKEHLARHKLTDEVINRETNRESDASSSKATYKLRKRIKKPFPKHNIIRNNTNLKSSRQNPFVARNLKNVHVPKPSLTKLLTGGARDSDEVFSEENASTRNKVKDNVFLENIKNGTDSDSDSDGPITDDSDENENEADSAPDHVREGGNEEKPDLDTKGKHVNKEGQEKAVTPDEDSDNDVDDKEEDNDAEEEDGTKPGHESVDEQQPLDSLKELREQDKPEKISPYQISNQMSQELMHIDGGDGDHTAATIDRERHLEALDKLMAYSAQLRQEMLQRFRLGYGKKFVQNTAVLPQFYVPQPMNVLAIPEAPRRVPLLLAPTASIYRPANVNPPRAAYFLPQSNNQGYSVNVDGLHGVFSKSPGYVVRFHSPDSEVTVVKKEKVANPMTATPLLQMETER